jgi:hypothetical protein
MTGGFLWYGDFDRVIQAQGFEMGRKKIPEYAKRRRWTRAMYCPRLEEMFDQVVHVSIELETGENLRCNGS